MDTKQTPHVRRNMVQPLLCPTGQTRVSGAVLLAIAMSAARDAFDELDVLPDATDAKHEDLFALGADFPAFKIQVSTRYGECLYRIATDVRSRLAESFASKLGGSAKNVDIVLVGVFQS